MTAISQTQQYQSGNLLLHDSLVILYSDDLEKTLALVRDAGGAITKDPIAFPGGRRFHFRDPSGNELAVWSESEEQAAEQNGEPERD